MWKYWVFVNKIFEYFEDIVCLPRWFIVKIRLVNCASYLSIMRAIRTLASERAAVIRWLLLPSLG